ncbi:MAG: outer membrane lipoprotein carrier protein LolA [Flavobacteriales bacterium]|nr:outer membrane lipoprotein carrier protein LolA [Flavobacteriales bacterium]
MKLILSICLVILGTTVSFGQDAKSQGILDKLSTKMKGMKSFYIEFSANIKNADSGQNDNETGKGWVKGSKFYASYGENTIISNGVKTWTVIKEEKSVYESDASEDDEESMNPKRLMTIWETGFKNKFDKEDKLNGEAVNVISLFPKNPSKSDFHTIVLYIAKADNELKKAVMKAKDGTTMTYSLTKFTSNPDIDDSKFVFDKKKYPGYPVIKD